MNTFLSSTFVDLINKKNDYNTAVRQLCNELPRQNKEIYRLILTDLIYHFAPTKSSPSRARVKRNGTLWTVDSYKTIAERISKPLSKIISAKTIQRYYTDLVDKGWCRNERHMFAGKNTLHRTINAKKLEFDLLGSLFTHLYKKVGELDEVQIDPNIEKKIQAAKESTSNITTDSPRTKDQLDSEVNRIILAGDLLFRLGNLNNSRRKRTRETRDRLVQLVDANLLSIDAIYTLHDAWVNGAFAGMPESKERNYGYWPNWLNDFYPNGRALCQGLAGYWFLEAEPTAHKWLNGEKLGYYLACMGKVIPAFERFKSNCGKNPDPEDYQAFVEDGRYDVQRSEIYFQRLYPRRDLQEMVLPFSKANSDH
ncbi:hypothetical protein [Cerasicoccus maritimus]|uniref:hypothetical protein n=1 Tax=Cerasicoccus maritimus TaxID=490089 RepID=UPI002852673C|nr:hypothetical protein [Cerasicoccus maritimus]